MPDRILLAGVVACVLQLPQLPVAVLDSCVGGAWCEHDLRRDREQYTHQEAHCVTDWLLITEWKPEWTFCVRMRTWTPFVTKNSLYTRENGATREQSADLRFPIDDKVIIQYKLPSNAGGSHGQYIMWQPRTQMQKPKLIYIRYTRMMVKWKLILSSSL